MSQFPSHRCTQMNALAGPTVRHTEDCTEFCNRPAAAKLGNLSAGRGRGRIESESRSRVGRPSRETQTFQQGGENKPNKGLSRQTNRDQVSVSVSRGETCVEWLKKGGYWQCKLCSDSGMSRSSIAMRPFIPIMHHSCASTCASQSWRFGRALVDARSRDTDRWLPSEKLRLG